MSKSISFARSSKSKGKNRDGKTEKIKFEPQDWLVKKELMQLKRVAPKKRMACESEEDIPLLNRKNPKKKVKKEFYFDDDEEEVKRKEKKIKAEKTKPIKVKTKTDGPSTTKRKQKQEDEPEVWKWDGVSPAVAAVSMPASPAAPALGKKKAAAASEVRERAAAGRTRRLMKELKEIQRLQESSLEPIFTVELVNDNLYEWHVRLHQIDPESELAGDLRELHLQYILLHLIFPKNFPFEPPFMRVIEPRIERGFVMAGGAICMELLTPRGWASAYTVEAVVMQFAATVVQGHGRVSRAPPRKSREFSLRRAEEEFRSIVKSHNRYGWSTPAHLEG